ncbi:uncharacterized protein LOC132199641 [Neocloeon triangulifer]|uniref:uncharacterized protein LOC132199641 n=1 Tax=Neocloeon triangulifer TaxID=2078957 RepID=UPI00286F0998|nr:uncharacterized protein LOC132199641 [Neocloeon triangulifer]
MKSLGCFLTTLVLLSAQARGYLYFVKNYQHPKQASCLTNTTNEAVAFVQQLNGNMTYNWLKNQRLESLDMQGNPIKQINNDCDLVNDKCNKWKLNWLFKKYNLPRDDFKPITDIRWNRLQSIITNGYSYTYQLLEYIMGQSSKFHLAVLATDNIQLLISDDKDLKKGYNIVLDGWLPVRRACIRYCPQVFENTYPTCRNLSKTADYLNVTKEGQQWALVTIEYNLSLRSKYIRVMHEDRVILQWEDTSASYSTPIINNGYLALRSHNDMNAIYKIHSYQYLQPNHNAATMESSFQIHEAQTICFDIIYIATLQPLIVKVDDAEYKSFENSIDGKTWLSWRIETQHLDVGTHKIVIQVGGQDNLIGGVYFCNPGPTLWKLNGGISRACQVVGSDLKTKSGSDSGSYYGSASTESRALSAIYQDPRVLCNAFGDLDCYKTGACNSKTCFCLSGYKTELGDKETCTKKCSTNFYGPNCFYYTVRHCKNEDYNTHSPGCLQGCESKYRAPYCTDVLLSLHNLPSPKEVKTYKVLLDFEDSILTMKNDFFGHAELNYRKADSANIFIKVNVTKEVPQEVWIENLQDNTEYIYEVIVMEKDGQFNPEVQKGTFKTEKCVPLGNDSFLIDVKSSTVTWKIIDSRKDDLCHLKLLKISSGHENLLTELVGGRNLDSAMNQVTFAFDKDKNYFIQLEGYDGSSFQFEYFDPSPQEQVEDTDFMVIAISALVVMILLIILIALLLMWRRGKRRVNSANQRLVEECLQPETNTAVELDLLPAPERSSARKSFFASTDDPFSRVVRVTELEDYIENAKKLDLLKKQHELFPRGQTQPWTVGVDPANKKKNRYANLAAYDSTRVQLPLLPGDEHSDYINANYIDGYKRPRAYIATQGPKPQTVADFWRMVWKEKTSVIIMVANLIENGKSKCEKYWPDIKQSSKYGNILINNTHEEMFADFVIRTLAISSDDTSRIVTQMHYTTWPDHGVPLYPQSVAAYARKLLEIKTESPITVHCSAGVGRTGTIILIDASLRMAAAEGIVDVLALLTKMRNQRANMVDNQQQYEFVHLVLLETLIVPQFSIPCKIFQSQNALISKQIAREFEKLNEICEKEWNRANKNAEIEEDVCRYPDIVASSNQLVKIFPYGSVTKTTFLNGVYVDGFRKKRQFIATQVPLPGTVEHFWRTVQQHKAEQIIVLNELGPIEGHYLPETGETLAFGDLTIYLQSQYELKDCWVKKIALSVCGGSPTITHAICCSNWAVGQLCGLGVTGLVELWEETERRRGFGVNVVVCHDGVSSSGLFLGLGFVLEKIKLEQHVDAALALRTLRQSRPKFIATLEQYELLLKAAITYLQAFDTYGNFQ